MFTNVATRNNYFFFVKNKKDGKFFSLIINRKDLWPGGIGKNQIFLCYIPVTNMEQCFPSVATNLHVVEIFQVLYYFSLIKKLYFRIYFFRCPCLKAYLEKYNFYSSSR